MSINTAISTEEVKKQLAEGKALHLIDVREHEEVAQGKIPGAAHIPLGELQDRMGELDKSKEYIMVCRSGSRSGMATDFLNSIGYNCINMVGGMMSWTGDVE